MVSDLKAELAKVKGEARLAREAAEKAVATSYDLGVRDTKVRLAEEVAAVCREYITLSRGVALDRATVPTDSDLRKAENIFSRRTFARFLTWLPPKSLSQRRL